MANVGTINPPEGFVLENHQDSNSNDSQLPAGFQMENNNPAPIIQQNNNVQKGSLLNPLDMISVIANRPSMLKYAMQNPINFQQHPFKRALQDAGAGFEVMEGIPAAAGLALQQGKPQNILPNIGGVLQGNYPAQRGDIMRAIGTPEPLAATVGLMSGMTPGSTPTNSLVGKTAGLANLLPENMAVNAIGKGIGNVSNTIGLTNLINTVGKPALAKVLSVFSQVPQQHVEKALSNPEILSNKWLANENNIVSNQYQKVVQPLIEDSSKTININPVKDIATDVGLLTKDGEFTRGFRKMTSVEQNKVLDWENQLSRGGDKSFNDVDGMIGEMDSALKKTYTQTDKGAVANFSNDGQRIINQMRTKLAAIRNSQYPEAGTVLDRYSNFKNAQNVYNSYNKYLPHLLQGLISGGVGMFHNAPLTAAMLINSVPKAQAGLIRSGAFATEMAKGIGAAGPEAAFNLWRMNQQNASDSNNQQTNQ